jgi:hypothetical protein
MLARKAALLSFAMLSLYGCDGSPFKSDSDIEAIAHDAAADVVSPPLSALRSQVEILEQKVRELEAADSEHQRMIRSLEEVVSSNARIATANDRLNDRRWGAYRTHTH